MVEFKFWCGELLLSLKENGLEDLFHRYNLLNSAHIESNSLQLGQNVQFCLSYNSFISV